MANETTLRVVEVFETLQGEGSLAGTPAVFVRLGGCNLWSGKDETRERDASRSGALCPTWCDTDFVKAEHVPIPVLAKEVAQYKAAQALVVITGGEPMLQLGRNSKAWDLRAELRAAGVYGLLALETNGTHGVIRGTFDHVTLSPKLPVDQLQLQECTDLKVVYPTVFDPESYQYIKANHRFIQPLASMHSVGKSDVDGENTHAAVRYCLEHPHWRLSIQSHKLLGLR